MNSQCVCDAYGMCPQGCPYCAVCSGGDGSEWVCPACGKPDSQLPIGHSVTYGFRFHLGDGSDAGPLRCEILPTPPPDAIERYLRTPAAPPKTSTEETR